MNVKVEDSRANESSAAWHDSWGNREFIERWIARGGWQGPIREMQTAMVVRMIPHPMDDLKAATPSAYHGPHNNGYLDEELAWLKEAVFEDVDCFWKFGTTVV
jgi:hypothetical protein